VAQNNEVAVQRQTYENTGAMDITEKTAFYTTVNVKD
jgi:hypothetical protein